MGGGSIVDEVGCCHCDDPEDDHGPNGGTVSLQGKDNFFLEDAFKENVRK